MTQRDSTERPGRLVLVMGSTRGIGFGIAAHLVKSGSHVMLHGRDRGRLREAETRVPELGLAGTVVGGVVADLTVPEQVGTMADEVLTRWGVPDGLVLNAGGSVVPPGPLEDIALDDWNRSLQDNLTSAFLTLKAFLPAMKERGSGSVVAVSSSVTRRPSAHSPVAYTAAKGGLEALVRCAAQQAGPSGVRVNRVLPETIMTERNEQAISASVRDQLVAAHPLRRLGAIEDVAAVVGFLLSPGAGWTTGEALGVTGGV